MTETEDSVPQNSQASFLTKATIVLVRAFGSWVSVLLHSIFFAGWVMVGLDFEVLLVIVSLEAIYIGIFILMAENVETAERERRHEHRRHQDMKVVKQDAKVDEMSLAELKQIRKQVNTLHNLLHNSPEIFTGKTDAKQTL